MTDFLVPPLLVPPLDPGFRPLWSAQRAAAAAARRSGAGRPVVVAVEQPGGAVETVETWILRAGRPGAPASRRLVERLVKTLLWSRGGSTVWVDGPERLVADLRAHYRRTPEGRFDAAILGSEVYGRPFEVVSAPRAAFPASRELASTLGGHLDGCRIGFDLGASDRKAAAVMDGRVVFSEEIAWDPVHHADPQWHVDQIEDSLRRAATHLPRVDAIGGSSAGIYVDSQVRVASLFRAVPPDAFRTRISGIFDELRERWGGIPFVVLNDGEVTALAGAMLAGVGGLLGVALGSSEAAGYVRPDGRLTSWLDELAFAPIDANPGAPVDEWSGDRGCGVQYLSQQAVARLLPVAGIEVSPSTSFPDRLVRLQEWMAAGDPRAAAVYATIGSYLGQAILWYRALYEIDHVLLLGRVMTGHGGELIQSTAVETLRAEDPGFAERLRFHHVSERDKRHGQAVAAASLPSLDPDALRAAVVGRVGVSDRAARKPPRTAPRAPAS